MKSRQARWAPPAAPGVAPRRASIRSRWPDWVGPAAAAWSLGYGLLGLHWTFGGAGFPFGTEHDPHAAKVSILEQVQQDTAAPVIVALGLGGAALAMVLARWRTRGPVGAALLRFAWTMALALTVVIPDVRPLTGVARVPIVLAGSPFGWPRGVSLPSLFPWPVTNQLLLIGGGLLWATAPSPTSAGPATPAVTAAAAAPPAAGPPPPAPPAGAAGRPTWRSPCPCCTPRPAGRGRLASRSGSPASSSASRSARHPSSGWPGPPLQAWRSAARLSPWGSSSVGVRSTLAGSRSWAASRFGRAPRSFRRRWSLC
jgi:hypothetical protein